MNFEGTNMLKGIFLALGLSIGLNCQAQFKGVPMNFKFSIQDKDGDGDSTVFLVVQSQPEFPGGYLEMQKFIKRNLNVPRKYKRQRRTVFVAFIIGKDGSLLEPQPSGDIEELKAEAVRIVKMMPKWTPGFQNGQPVFIQFVLPIHME